MHQHLHWCSLWLHRLDDNRIKISDATELICLNAQGRTARKRSYAERLTHFITTADKIHTPPYEAIMNAVTQIPAVTLDHDIDVLGRAATIFEMRKVSVCPY